MIVFYFAVILFCPVFFLALAGFVLFRLFKPQQTPSARILIILLGTIFLSFGLHFLLELITTLVEVQANTLSDNEILFDSVSRLFSLLPGLFILFFWQFYRKLIGELQESETTRKQLVVANGQMDELNREHQGTIEALKASESRFRSVLENLDELIVIFNPGWQVQFISQSTRRFLGLSDEEFASHEALNLIHPQDLAAIRAAIEEMKNGTLEQKSFSNIRFQNSRGEWRYATGLLSNQLRNPYINGLVFNALDVTEQVQAIQAVEAEKDFARQIMDNMGQGLTVTDKDSRFIYVNSFYAGLMDYPVEELLGKTPSEVSPPDEIPRLQAIREERRAGNKSTYESKLVKRDGSIVDILVTSVPVTRQGLHTGSIAVVSDLTEIKKTEAERRLQQQYLEALHDTALTLINHLDINELLQAIVTRAADLVGSASGYIYLVDSEEKTMSVRVGTGRFVDWIDHVLNFGEGASGKAWETGETIIANDYRSWYNRLLGQEWDDLYAVACLPLKSGNKVVGVIGLAYQDPNKTFGEKEEKILTRFAQLASLALDNANLYTSANRRLAELTTLQNIVRSINSNLELEQVFQNAVQQIKTALGYHMVSLLLLDGEKLVVTGHAGYDQNMPLELSLNRGVTGRVVRTGIPAFVKNVDEDSDFQRYSKSTRQLIAIPLRSKQGQIVGCMLVSSNGNPLFTDDDFSLLQLLAEQVSIAVENARLFSELRRSEEQYRQLVTNLKEIVIQMDAKGYWTFLNPAWEEVLGYKVEESLGKSGVDYLHPDERETVWTSLRDYLHGNTTTFRREIRFIASNGQTRYLEGQAQRVIDADGRLRGIVGTLMDVTERKEAEEKRLKLERQLLEAQRMESLGIMAGGIAHDFNNLLVSIMGNAELASIELPSGHPVNETISQITVAAIRAAELTRQMLAFSGKGRFVIKSIHLNSYLQEVKPVLLTLLHPEISLELELAAELPALETDPSQLQQLLVNLVINSAEAIGSKPGRITLKTGLVHDTHLLPDTPSPGVELSEGPYILLEINDNGSGMDEEIRARIFDPFFSTKFTGRGLGLSAVQGIVRGHRGVILVESKPGHGTSFKMLLPVKAVGQIVRPASPAETAEAKVLLIDDDELLVRATSRMLNKMGVASITSTDGREALELYRKNKDQIGGVILDLTMPGIGGEGVLRELLNINPQARVLLMSGMDHVEFWDRYASKTSLEFLKKPFTSKEMGDKLRSIGLNVHRELNQIKSH